MKNCFVLLILITTIVFGLFSINAADSENVNLLKSNPADIAGKEGNSKISEQVIRESLEKVIEIPEQEMQEKALIERQRKEVEESIKKGEEESKRIEGEGVRIEEKKDQKSQIERFLAGDVPQKIDTDISQFGYDIFSKDISTFAPVSDVPVGPEYIIGPGDAFSVTLWGSVNQDVLVQVDRSGKIIIPKIGTIYVSGMSAKNLEHTIKKKFSEIYSDFDISITYKALRTIDIYVVGEVKNPGSYKVSSLSTLFTALFNTGGPTKNGSLRDIRLIRNGQVIAHFDMYDFLLTGQKKDDQRILSGDTIFIPRIGPTIGVAGNVGRPAIYEFKESKITLNDAIKLADGLTRYSFLGRIQVERTIKHKRRIINDLIFDEDKFKEAIDENGLIKKNFGENFTLENGDLVKVFTILSGRGKVVYLQGHVLRDGAYEYREGLAITDLVPNLDFLLPEPFLDFAYIRRIVLPDRHNEIITFNLGKILKGEEENIKLNEQDEIRVFGQNEFENLNRVSIRGEIGRSSEYPLLKNMTLKDLIFLAGGIKKDAYYEFATLRRVIKPDMHTKIITFDLGKLLSSESDSNMLLQPLDDVTIFNRNDFETRERVYIQGEIRKPGDFELDENMTLKDLILLAGGLKKNAYTEHGEFTRLYHSEKGTRSEIREINLAKVLANDKKENILLKAGDLLLVRSIPLWYTNQTVTVGGEVKFPGVYTFERGERLASILKRAGGFTERAYLPGAFFTRLSVKKVQQERLEDFKKKQEEALLRETTSFSEGSFSKEDSEIFRQNLTIRKNLINKLAEAQATGRVIIKLNEEIEKFAGSEYNLVLEVGDSVHVPPIPSTVNVIGEVFNPNSIIFTKSKSVNHYLSKVGGITDDADNKNLFIIKADGTVLSQKNNDGLIFGRFFARKLERGDSILVPKDVKPAVNVLGIARDVSQILFNLATTTGIIWTVGK